MGKPNEMSVQHYFRGVEIWTQIWYDALRHDTPRLSIAIEYFRFNDIYQYSPGRWAFGDYQPLPGNCGEDAFLDMLSAYQIAREFLQETNILPNTP